jgi:diguanylate cyclase (GGDEF)-like protein
MKILVVEDSAADLRLLSEALKAAGDAQPEVSVVRTLADAEAAVRAGPFDCVLLDLGLPDGVGVENVQRVRAARRGQTVVVISGSEGEEIAMQTLRHGAQDYLYKGRYTGEVVMRVMRRAMERNEQLLAMDRQREEQFQLATRDELTGLPNRRSLEQLAQNMVAQSARRNWRFALAFMDLDGFKAVNDTHGHACGDQLLREVAGALTRSVRDIDAVARLGGDEFLVLLAPPFDADQALAVVRRVQDAIASLQRIGDHAIKVGASFGIAFYPDHATSLDGLIAGADQAMYRAKHGTPGRVALYAPLGASPRATAS